MNDEIRKNGTPAPGTQLSHAVTIPASPALRYVEI